MEVHGEVGMRRRKEANGGIVEHYTVFLCFKVCSRENLDRGTHPEGLPLR